MQTDVSPRRAKACVRRVVLTVDRRAADRYLRHRGQGTFGKVVEVMSLVTHKAYAVKIIRTGGKYEAAGKIEVAVLKKLKETHSRDHRSVVRSSGRTRGLCLLTKSDGRPVGASCVEVLEVFEHKGHKCIKFDLLGPSLEELSKSHGRVPFVMGNVQSVGRQMLMALQRESAVAAWATPRDGAGDSDDGLWVSDVHEQGIIHTDVKPENTLLASSCIRVRKVKVRGVFDHSTQRKRRPRLTVCLVL